MDGTHKPEKNVSPASFSHGMECAEEKLTRLAKNKSPEFGFQGQDFVGRDREVGEGGRRVKRGMYRRGRREIICEE